MKRSIYKFLLLFLTFAMVLSLAVCTKKNDNGGGNPDLKFDAVYAAAVDLGFEGSLEDLIAAFKGDSAYQIAVSKGYAGTETQWLLSLVGANGNDGITPHIGSNGNWYIGATDTGVLARGTNGKDGANGKNGTNGTNGSNGAAGQNGANGKSAYEIYIENNPDYTGGEAQWLDDLINGRLAADTTYTVTFYKQTDNGLSVIDAENVIKGSKISAPDVSFDDGFVAGWYKEKELINEWNFANDTVTSNIVLFAKIEQGTEGLQFTLIDDNTAYEVSIPAYYRPTITEIIIPSSYKGLPVTKIAGSAFLSCINLREIFIPDSIAIIGYGAFANCSSLETITIPANVTVIKNNAFFYCGDLETIIIPASVMIVGDKAFDRCDSLAAVYYGGADETAWNNISIGTDNDTLTNATIYYYSETQPLSEGNYWRYINGVPTVWENVTLELSGVTDGGVYEGSVTPVLTGGSLILNGEQHTSGAAITMPGTHYLKVLNKQGQEVQSISFKVNLIHNLPTTYSISIGYQVFTPEISGGIVTLNDEPYVVGTQITLAGAYRFAVTGVNGFSQNFGLVTIRVGLSGVNLNETWGYHKSVTPIIEGAVSILLNGEPFISGTVINKVGQYSLYAYGLHGVMSYSKFYIHPDVNDDVFFTLYENRFSPVDLNLDWADILVEPLMLNNKLIENGTTITEVGYYELYIGDYLFYKFNLRPHADRVSGIKAGGVYTSVNTITVNWNGLTGGSVFLDGGPYNNAPYTGWRIDIQGNYVFKITGVNGYVWEIPFSIAP